MRTENGGGLLAAGDRPGAFQSPMADSTFTIDDHRARTHHFDLRLRLGGSVVLWAVSPAMPAPGDAAQEAIRIDQLPLARFGSNIGGTDRIPWDHGRMTVRTWREGRAAVVTLHGSQDGGLGGTRTVSLVHVGSVWEDDDLWTIVALDDSSY